MRYTGLSMRPPVHLIHKTSAPARQGNIEYIRVYLSIFEYIQDIFKEYSENMSNTPGLRKV
jgi:hypothetical protein